MALRNIINYQTDDILRKKVKIVENVNSRIRSLLEDMAETMYHADGAGLAAPQVGILRRLVVINIGAGLIKLVNPVIVEDDGEQQKLEGCRSIPGIYGKVKHCEDCRKKVTQQVFRASMVKRPKKVMVKALDENGKPFDIEGTGAAGARSLP